MHKPPNNTKHEPLLLKANLKQLRLPTIGAEFEKLAREAADANQSFEQYLLRLTELEVAARQTNALRTRIKQANFPVIKDLDTFDFTAITSLHKQQVLELTRSPWIDQHYNACFVGNNGTGKTHVAIALGLTGGGRVPATETGAFLHRRQPGHSTRRGAEEVPVGTHPGQTRQGGPVGLRRTGLSVIQPRRRRVAVSGLRRSL